MNTLNLRRKIGISCTFIFILLTISLHAQKEEWEQLFNGKDLSGWEHTGPGEFIVEDGVLRTVGGMGLLWYSREKLQNIVLRVVYTVRNNDTNSGIFIRIPEEPTDPLMAVNAGYEVQIDNGFRHLHDDYHCTGVLYSCTKAAAYPQKRPGEWNVMEITLEGPRTVVNINGKEVTDFTEGDEVPQEKRWFEPDRGPRPDAGYIGLQNYDDFSVVLFREISVKRLK